ncbi:MAG: B12-binding domain-containing radical SAM protein [Lachnospiraceae bacterium]|nr:B12-binding domain-containing radical SAM protein [Lachnospiraceae bacterium]
MKILLAAVNAKYIHSNLAVYSLKAVTRRFGEQIEIGEYTINQQMDEILSDIYRKQPDVVAFSCYIWNARMIGELLEELPKVLPQVKLWVGGPEVSYDAKEFLLKYPKTTGVMRGEGEKIFENLCAYYIEEKGSLSGIRGITFWDEQGVIFENPAEDLVNMDSLPFAYEELDRFKHKIIYYESSRGCPFRCSYCLSSIDKSVRYRSLDLVKKELSCFLDAQIPQVKFVDRTFNCHPSRTKELWQWMIDHDNGITNFHFEVAADLITEEELALMSRMRPGLIQLEIGVQSTNPDTVRKIDRTMDIQKVADVVAKVKSFGNIHQHLDLIAGLPEEDLESFKRSFDDVFRMEPEQLQLGFLKVLKGAKMHQKALEYGISYHTQPVYEVLATRWISYTEILLLKGVEEMVEVYYNSHQFERTIQELLKRYESPFDFFHELALYYEGKGYAKISHSRMARYDILREFLQDKGWKENIFDQCMVYDLYARENLKSRPVFAAELSPYKEQLKQYTREYGRQVHVEVFEQEDGPVFVMFDYRRRNPLTNEAYVEKLRG